ncbi:metal-dependent hydrolase beta-lactamase superfamily II [Clostridium aceticum]|uniref:Metal-dependent hydrolase beta-lactamase superfamily II n=1 Tax=Clostridium aceticum TaxID=84022 RepID=A0A0D8I5Q7_9CLOT|nr:MBL fold metallo-hydrolase [Clostridium aceticum]AKL96985.1 metal-dependent hydrolase beta-lactamase superfamily II [Clostridium aceticum]KJF25635.1 beta-lactamase [Clostridium aceticum]
MKIVTLLENRTTSKDYKCKHGLSLYIETIKHKILFDTGANHYFIDNARKMGVNLEEIDVAIISHGHYDHGGGLEDFLKINNRAKVYIGKEAFNSHIIKLFGLINYNIGLKKVLRNNERFIKIDGTLNIDDELTLFSDITESKLLPLGNNKLYKKNETGAVIQDDFNHEINLLVKENNTYNLICGCAHKGIINIINRAKELTDANIKTVIGGFHLMGMKIKNPENQGFLEKLERNLSSNGTEKYYTCHCTGKHAYDYLRQKMTNIGELKTGMTIDMEICN